MMKLLAVLLIPFALAAVPLGRAEERRPSSRERQALVDGNTAFAFDLYRKLSQTEKGNLFLSPYSISNTLALVLAGAEGRTAAEMAQTLHLPLDAAVRDREFGGLIQEVNSPNGSRPYQLNNASALWVQRGVSIRDRFDRQLQACYGGKVAEVDFLEDTEQARRTINAWIKDQTQDKIDELLKPGCVPAQTQLLLTNAVYFRAGWHYPFARKETREGAFRVTRDQKVPVPFMRRIEELDYWDNLSFQALELPYKGGAVRMLVLVPRKVDGLRGLEKSLTTKRLAEIQARLKPHLVDVTLPRFKVTADLQLRQPLTELGMSLAFSSEADFSGMTPSKQLAIGEVVHKAYVDVNEEGTEAAAATGLGFQATSAGTADKVTFRADRPFLFLILEQKTGSVLFLGRVVNPQ